MASLTVITDFIGAHANLAYLAIFLLAFIEAAPVIGFVVPGVTIIVAAAALVPTGALMLWPLVIATVSGAILGDGFSYWLGHRYHGAILCRWPLSRYPEAVNKSRAFVERHGGKGVFISRFTWGRAFVPVVAGILQMPAGRFHIANVVSAFVWTATLIIPGILLGASIATAGAAVGRLVALLVIAAIMVWVVTWIVRLALRKMPSLAATVETRLWRLVDSRRDWLSRQVQSLLESQRGEGRALLLSAIIVVAAAWLFLGILEDVVTGDPLIRADVAIYQTLQHLRTPAADAVMTAITELGDPVVVASVTIAVCLWLAFRREWRTAVYWAAAVGFAAALNTITKLAIHRVRPGELDYIGASQFSFPSGHATVNAVLYGFLAFLIARQAPPAWRLPIFAVALSFAMLIALSRLYLGAHWFSDVAGSLAFATVWMTVLGIAYVHHQRKPPHGRSLAAVACATLVLVGGLNIYRNHRADMNRYAAVYEVATIAAADWWANGWKRVPAYRIAFTGEEEEPLTFQWAGSLDGLAGRLERTGWHVPEPWAPSNALSWLTTSEPEKLPVIPSLEAGRMASMTLIRKTDDTNNARFVLRLWPADLAVRNGDTHPLWIGSVVEERFSRPFSFVTISQAQTDLTNPLSVLARSVEGERRVKRDVTSAGWDGSVILLREGASGSETQIEMVPK